LKKEEDGVTTTITVEPIENGFIIVVSKEWEDKIKKDGLGRWRYETKKYYSKTNPLDTKIPVWERMEEEDED